jgi:hypothetical protein
MSIALWQLLLEDPSDLTCDECFAVMEYYAEALTGHEDLLPRIIEHLKRCPECALQHRRALRRLIPDPSQRGQAPLDGATTREGSEAKGPRHSRQGREKKPGEERCAN